MTNSQEPLTVYGKPACVQCTATERYLVTNKVNYVKIDVSQSPEAFDYVVGLGYQQVPVVVTPDGEHWGGFDPDRLAVYV